MAKPWKEIGRYGSVGIELVVAILLLAGIGHWIDDRYWGRRDWGLGAGFALGIAVGVRNLIRAASHMQADIEQAEAADPEAGRWTVDESWLHEGQASQAPREAEPHPTPRSDKEAK